MSSYSEPVVRRSIRTRTLTKPGLTIYQVTVNNHYDKLNEIKSELRNLSQEIERGKISDKETLLALEKVASCGETAFQKNTDILRDYLRTTRTVESKNELVQLDTERDMFFAKSNAVRKRIQGHIQQLEFDVISERQSELSRHSSSHRSSQSTDSSILRRKEAKLEAQRARMRHLDEELALEAKLKQLKAKRDLEMMEREVDALKEQSDHSWSEVAPSVNSIQRTRDYVQNLPEPETKKAEVHTLNPTVPPFVPKGLTQYNSQSEIVNTFTKHLVKQELIQTRLAKYDDDPMMFVAWKTSFLGIMKEVSVTKTEELELLCEKLGPESSKQAKKIRGYNAENPGLACDKIWERLEKRYGAPEMIEARLHSRIKDFPVITAEKYRLLYDLTDLALEISAIKSQPKFSALFAYFDSKRGVNELVEKLPWNIKEKWTSQATRYKEEKGVLYPPFEFFVKFLENMASMRNDPAFQFERKVGNQRQVPTFRQDRLKSSSAKQRVTVLKTETVESSDVSEICPLHKNGRHVLNECRPFRQKSINERKKIILTSGICFRCCSGKKHRAKKCKVSVTCNICQASTHPTALHEEDSASPPFHSPSLQTHEGEGNPQSVTAKCAHVSGVSKSCAKIIPVRVFHESDPEKAVVVYATIDDQSNQSLATSSLFDHFDDQSTDVSYTLVSCSGAVAAAGRMCNGYKVQSLDGSCQLNIPSLLECNDIPSNRNEFPSPDVATLYPHLSQAALLIPPVIEDAGKELLIGRDIIHAHVVEDQILGEEDQQFAQKLPLGWVIVGQVCFRGAHIPEVRTMKTYILGNGRHARFQPCENELSVQRDLFVKTDQDERVGLSIEDRTFLDIMEESFEKDEHGRWTAPLPFKKDRTRLPNNRSQALQRARSLNRCLRHNEQKYAHVKDFMEKLFTRGHAEKAPVISQDEECWFLPMFGVYHPKKLDAIRVVFDSSAQCEGISLNDVLIKGPDLANNLQGILMRFRLEEFAIMADVEQMFHNFRVAERHRNYLRFFWHPNHDLDSPLEEFRMTVHVFGYRTSPAVANYGLRKSVSSADSDVQRFVSDNFYVDDGLMSFPSADQAVSLLKMTQTALHEGGCLKLNKIASNATEILEQFPKEDLAKDLKDLDLGRDCLPEQRSLGICWNIVSDHFSFRVDKDSQPCTRRHVLSVINSLFDPIGFTAPVTLEGRILMREAMSSKCDWDDSLPESLRIQWEKWVDELGYLQNFSIPRMYCSLSVELSSRVEIHIFSDASKDAVVAVAFIKVFAEGCNEVGFLTGKAKVAPVHGHTIPRLELCAALLAVEIAENIREQLDLPKDVFTFYTDSLVALGYISNDSKRFHVYVANRVSRIRSFCGPQSWRYVTSDQNAADIGTRGCSASELPNSLWINGPSFLRENRQEAGQPQDFDVVNPDEDAEVRKQISCVKSSVIGPLLGCERFERFSTWSSLVRAIMCLKRLIKKHKLCSVS